MAEAEEVARLFRGYWDAEEARDVDRVLTFWSSDGEFVDRLGSVVQGHDALRRFYEGAFARFPRAKVALRQVIGTAHAAAVQYDATLWDESDTPHDVRVVVIAACRDGKIARLESYFDSAAFA